MASIICVSPHNGTSSASHVIACWQRGYTVSTSTLTVTFVPARGWVVRPARAESGEIRAHSARKSKSSREIAN